MALMINTDYGVLHALKLNIKRKIFHNNVVMIHIKNAVNVN